METVNLGTKYCLHNGYRNTLKKFSSVLAKKFCFALAQIQGDTDGFEPARTPCVARVEK